jgi:hypothetical protein
MNETTKRITHDQADEACDKVEFVACAIAQMGMEYTDNVVCGCMNVLMEAADLLRAYSKQYRAESVHDLPEGMIGNPAKA